MELIIDYSKCRKCENIFLKSKDNFYMSKGRLQGTICKGCRVKQIRDYEKKNPVKRDRRDEYRIKKINEFLKIKNV